MQKPIQKTGNWLKPLLWHVAVLGLSIVVGYALLVLVNCIPQNWLKQQAMETADVLGQEQVYQSEGNTLQSLLDNYTDAYMLGEAAYTDENPFINAIMSRHYSYRGSDPFSSYLSVWKDHTSADPAQIAPREYPRYWHGFLVLLKPLLLVLNYGQIRLVNRVLLCVLFCAVLVLMKKRGNMHVNMLSLGLMAVVMIPEAVVKSLQYSTTTYAMILATLIILLQNPKRPLWWFSCLFTLFGAVTVYVDFLTYPTLALSVPLCTLLTLKPEDTVWQKLRLACACVLAWFFGYGGMWAGKWLLGLIIIGPDFLSKYVIEAVQFRASSSVDDWDFTRGEIIRGKYLDCFFNPVVETMFYVLVIGLAAWLVLRCIRDRRCYFTHLLPQLIVLLVPVVWTFVLSNHSACHWYTYRTFASVIYMVPAALAAAPFAGGERISV